ncbi:MAG: hypothetical protein M1136_12530 [Chloroflexi bacterium]|nr:hypothetical protein [Chloroflexota bacterium]MCL5076450.1 hypothetical protein [Chloroflexota bacterium]
MAEITYFEKTGPQNTAECLRLARQRASELGIKTIVVATTFGDTGLAATEVFKGLKLVVVTHCTGFREPNQQEVPEEKRQAMIKNGVQVLTCLHAFGGIGRAVRKKFHTYELEELIANALRIFGEGTKVACEIVLMAADAGLVRTDEEVIAIGGTGRGADTALVIKPAHTQHFFDLKVKEIICKPRL